MAHIPTIEKIIKNYEKHKKEILDSGYRFAVVGEINIKYYDNREKLYKDFPIFDPDQEHPPSEASPKLIDIGEITNSLEYRIENNQEEIKECDSVLKMFNSKKYRLKEEKKELLREEKLLRKNIS